MRHELKILKVYFEAVLNGTKNFEIRNNSDRGFQAGDIVQLNEVRGDGVKTNRSAVICITYVTNYEQKPNMVVFGFKLTDDINLDAQLECENCGGVGTIYNEEEHERVPCGICSSDR